jgi:RND family efflux transporter MFP subunit
MSESDANKADLAALKIDRSGQNRPPGRWKRWLHLLWLALPVVLYFTYERAIQEVTPALKVRTATVRMITGSEAAVDLVATGYVVAQVKAAVASKATGRLRVLNVEEGDSARANDVLAELENDDISANLDLTIARLKRARSDSVVADLNYRRQKKLFESGHATNETVESATAIYHGGVADVEAAVANVRAAEVALENTIIRAPFDGTVLTKHADVGEMVAPFASASSSKGAVVTMADMKSLEVEADVSESNIQKVQVGGPCEIILDAYPQIKYNGYVKKIVPTADRTRATVLTKIAFDDIDSRVLPEMSARVNFLPVTDEKPEEVEPIMAVSSKALTMRDGNKVVFRVMDDVAQSTLVEPGRQLGDVTEIISGLQVGDKVILSPAGGLESGDKVEITN